MNRPLRYEDIPLISEVVDGVKPYRVRTGCGHIVIRKMRESTAGVPFSADVVIEAPNGRPCAECEPCHICWKRSSDCNCGWKEAANG